MGKKLSLGLIIALGILSLFIPFMKVEAAKNWDWPFPQVGERSFSSGQLFGFQPNNGRTNSYHNGLDFGSNTHPGSKVQAVRAGKVIYTGIMAYGIDTIVVTKNPTDNFFVIYQEFGKSAKEIGVKIGQQVNVGTVIGTRTTSHLHVGMTTKSKWEEAIWYSFDYRGQWLNPQTMIKNGQSQDRQVELSQYYTTNPNQVGTLVNTSLYTSPELTGGSKVRDLPQGTFLKVDQVITDKNGLPRLKVAGGYLTAEKKVVVQSKIAPTNFHLTNPKQVGVKVPVSLFKTKELAAGTKVKDLPTGTLLTIQGIEYASNGEPRLKTAAGYVTAEKKYTVVSQIAANAYHLTNPKQVGTTLNLDVYQTEEFKSGTKVKTIAAGSFVPVQGITFAKNGEAILKIKEGFVVARKNASVKSGIVANNYHVVKPKAVKLTKTTELYRQTVFNPKTQIKKVPVGAAFQVQKIEYASDGQPRLKVAGGYLSAQKTISLAN